MVEDKELYLEFLKGNDTAFEELIEKYRKNIIAYLCYYTKDIEDAEDIFQEIIIYILENKERYNDKYSFKTYLYLIAKSRALNFIHNRKQFSDFEKIDNEIPQNNLLEEIILEKEKLKKIIYSIDSLKDEYSLVIYLTQIEELSYYETGVIMNKSEKQVKNLLYYAKKKLRTNFKKEGIKNYKQFIKMFIILITLTIAFGGIVFATIEIYKYYNAQLIPTYAQEIKDSNSNTIWIGSFKLAWEQLKYSYFNGNIEFEDKNNKIKNFLDTDIFSKEMLNEESYYILISDSCTNIEHTIKSEIQNKFNIDISNNLKNTKFINSEGYIIYSMIYKQLEFVEVFDRLCDDYFNSSSEKVKYFGIQSNTNEKTRENVEVMFHNEDEFAIKLKTNEEDEIILYRTNEIGKDFQTSYNEVIRKSQEYSGSKNINIEDKVKIPYINVDTIINYNELCEKNINGTKKYITNALQSVIFSINNNGVNIISDANIKMDSLVELNKGREFKYNKPFILFIKERNTEIPYFALKVENIDIMEK